MLHIAEEVARLWLAGYSEQERGWVPRRELENWLGLMQGVGLTLLRLPLVFGRWAHASFTLSDGGAVATRGADETWHAAASNVVMRSGRHFVQFMAVEGFMLFGVIRPDWDVEGGANAHTVDGHCFYATTTGSRYPGAHNWEGMQGAQQEGGPIGMLLDLDQGSMTVWKNDKKLGVMVAEGVRGPLCWAVEMFQESSARIESAPLPA